jgi:hypothetical protein
MNERDGGVNRKNRSDSNEAEMERLYTMGNQQRNLSKFLLRETFNDYYRTLNVF